MSHWYSRDDNGECYRVKSVTTDVQARKHSTHTYASVTTKIAIIKGFVDTWARGEAIRHTEQNPRPADQHPKEYVEWIGKKVFKEYTRPYDGKVFWSADFGIAVHEELEEYNKDQQYQFPIEWEQFCVRWPQWLSEEEIEPLHAEKLVICDRLKTAGSIDFIGNRRKDDRLVMVDYKCRECPKGTGKYYDKDCQQLSIESKMLAEEMNLDYYPDICSMVINAETGAYYPKWWSEAKKEQGIKEFEAISHCYNVLNGY